MNARLLPFAWALVLALAGFGFVLPGCGSSGSTGSGAANEVEFPLPEIPYELAMQAEFPEVEPLEGANQYFARAYREEEAASRADNHEAGRHHLLQALAFRRRGLELAPDQLFEHQRYQNHLALLGQADHAYLARLIVEYHDAWAADPYEPTLCYLFGRACKLLDQWETAQALFVRGLEAAPNDYWLNIARGAIAWQLDDQDTAIRHLERAAPIGLTSGEMSATRLLGRVYASLGRYDVAAEQLHLVVRAAPQTQIEDYEILATCWAQLGKYNQAEQMLLYEIPDYLATSRRNMQLRTLGDLYRQQGRYDAAEWAYELYLEFHPEANDRHRIEEALNEVAAALNAR